MDTADTHQTCSTIHTSQRPFGLCTPAEAGTEAWGCLRGFVNQSQPQRTILTHLSRNLQLPLLMVGDRVRGSVDAQICRIVLVQLFIFQTTKWCLTLRRFSSSIASLNPAEVRNQVYYTVSAKSASETLNASRAKGERTTSTNNFLSDLAKKIFHLSTLSVQPFNFLQVHWRTVR